MSTLKTIPLNKLTDPWMLLRPVLKDSTDYLELKTSMDENGLINSIAVRPSPRKTGFYEVIDGMWRTTAARELGFKSIPCIIKNATNEDVLTLQIQANAIRPETKPVEFAKQLRRIQKAHDGITLRQLSSMVNKNTLWVQLQLGLLRLSKEIQKSIDRGEISLGNAYMLVKIPPRLRSEYIDNAKTMKPPAFKALAASVIKYFQEAIRQGKLDAFFTDDFKAQPYLKPLKEIQAEADTKTEAALIIATELCKTPLDGWIAALHWAMHIDKGGQEEQEIAACKRAHKTLKGPQTDTERTV